MLIRLGQRQKQLRTMLFGYVLTCLALLFWSPDHSRDSSRLLQLQAASLLEQLQQNVVAEQSDDDESAQAFNDGTQTIIQLLLLFMLVKTGSQVTLSPRFSLKLALYRRHPARAPPRFLA